MTTKQYNAVKTAGFSLVEMVVAIVVMSIISIGLVQFIMDSAQGYIATAGRNQLSASGRVVIDRISVELHNALPNSVRISTPYPATDANAYAGDQCIEFIPVRAATTYIDPPFGSGSATFDVVEFVPDQTGVTSGEAFAVIYPNNTGQIYEDPVPSRGPRQAVTSISHDVTLDIDHVVLTSSHRFRRRSPVERIFLTDQPVSYCVKGNRIYRYSDYGFNDNQPRAVDIGGGCTVGAGNCLPASTPGRVLISTELNNTAFTGGASPQAFDQIAATRRRNAVIQLELNFSKNDEEVLLNHEVLLQSTP